MPIVSPEEGHQPSAENQTKKLHGAAKLAFERKKAADEAAKKGGTTPKSSRKRPPANTVDLTTYDPPKRKKPKTKVATPKSTPETEDDDLDLPLAKRAPPPPASPDPNTESVISRPKQKARSNDSKTNSAKKTSTASGRITKQRKSKTRAADKEGAKKTLKEKVSQPETEQPAENEQPDPSTPTPVPSKGSEPGEPVGTPKSKTKSRSSSKKKVRTIIGPAGAQKLPPLEKPSETLNENEATAQPMEEDVRSDDQMIAVSKRKKSKRKSSQGAPGSEKVIIRSADALSRNSKINGIPEGYEDEELLGLLDRMQRQALSFLRVQDNLIDGFSSKIVPGSFNFFEANADGEGAFSKAEEDAVKKERLKQRIDSAKIQLRREIETSLRMFALSVKTEENAATPTLLRDVDGKQELEDAVMTRRHSLNPVGFDEVRPFAGITNVRRFVGFSYNSLEIDDRSKCILKLCTTPGGHTYEYLHKTSGIGMKTIHSRVSELLDMGFLSEGTKMVGDIKRRCFVTTVSDK